MLNIFKMSDSSPAPTVAWTRLNPASISYEVYFVAASTDALWLKTFNIDTYSESLTKTTGNPLLAEAGNDETCRGIEPPKLIWVKSTFIDELTTKICLA